jgi:hypothetical protein
MQAVTPNHFTTVTMHKVALQTRYGYKYRQITRKSHTPRDMILYNAQQK